MSDSTKHFLRFLIDADLRVVKLLLALSSLFWCAMLFMPENTFIRPTYENMAVFAKEEVWAVAFGVHGVMLLTSVTSCFQKWNNTYIMLFDALFGCILWTTAVVCMLVAVYPPPAAIASEITSVIASWWILLTYDNNNNASYNINNGPA